MAAKTGEEKAKSYGSEHIKVLEGLEKNSSMEYIRKNFDILELSKKVKKKGDLWVISQELKVTPSVLKHIIDEAIILNKFPDVHKSKANALVRIKTDRELVKFAELNDINKLSVRELYNAVKNWNAKIQNNPLLIISQEEHDVIMGSLLGDSSIRQRDRNCCFRFSHSLKQKEYARWKMEKLNSFPISEFREVKRKINHGFIHAVDFSTYTHPVFNYYRNLFYKNGRKIVSSDILNQLTPRAIAVWLCDDGSYSATQGYIILCTNAYTLEEHELMKKFFNDKFGLNPTIGFRDGKYYYLRFKQEDSKRLIEIVKPFIPLSMTYKVGEINNG